ncbi:diadenylate cyclase CdaA [Capnocytophaga catalasegens]|uniref:Diadenylate cyclase n=1 Tax=Capnocytophaga catalasegens TaxID=1004260 RepID=A0AAV5AXL9_9FLAO|nr:diadenylate cyclase CdaA [Capnocytophaga catalasegens]GIZ16308.1 membrane protein [Capnocytophaga catalasegens]GJM50540.1 membrane protein [Capnocytophaga catalasegens]GJM53219.1 membrane protein [Capnocytophaga catalasegens]
MFKAFDFLDFSIIDAIDIILVGLLLYYIYKLLKGSVAINIFLGIVIIFVIWKVTQLVGMELLSGILGQFIGMGFFALIVVFQQEIRKFLLVVGSTNITKKGFFKKLSFLRNAKIDSSVRQTIETLVSACRKMGLENTGALIILERNQSLDFVKNSGDKMNIEVNQPILESIFYKNSPLHDGAIIVEENYVVATRVILPVVSQSVIPKRFGLRHRAAISITEKTDATALVVSEETGKISYIKNGEFVLFNTDEELIQIMEKDFS